MQATLEIQPPPAENLPKKDVGFSFPSSSSMAVDTQNPAKKQTRQWAAWTHQEEENFFNALRQVGKNFEKITCRVQSKNKNQVRHYYYRLVRRMNKLLGPGLSLDAKNSKDTNAAMLRWWSLLEKYNWTASKLHLKPRRFKIFTEALENQLLKDRNKTRRKRPCQGESYLATPSTTSIPSMTPGNDGRPVKLLVVDTQNTHKLFNKGASLRRNVSANISFSKGELSPMKTVRQKRRPGLVASAAYKRWEKAAMAGVSMVADAAEQLERATSDGNCSFDQGTFVVLSNDMYTIGGQKDIDSIGNTAYHLPSPTTIGMCSHQVSETTIQTPTKLKLQLFPVDEGTRKALEKDAHNPHLELTLSARKKISSVLEHLNRKWGNSNIASGELMLFPYGVQQEDIASNQKWTIKDTVSSAADVYAIIGSPTIFRLRYGWLSSKDTGTRIVQVPSPAGHFGCDMHSEDIQEGFTTDAPNAKTINVDAPRPAPPISQISDQSLMSSKVQLTTIVPPVSFDEPEPMLGDYSVESKHELPESSGQTPSSLPGEKIVDGCSRKQPEDVVDLGMRNCGTLSAGEWADSLTNFSVGDLLSEASKAAHSSCFNSSIGGSAPCPQHNSFSCDSFDAAVAAHISGHQLSSPSTQVPLASIWNAEETCDEFSFQMVPAHKREDSDPSFSKFVGTCRQSACMNSLGFQGYFKDLTKCGPSNEPLSCEDLKADCESAKDPSYNGKYDSAKDICLTEIYWPDSLGPLDLDIPSSRYQGEDLVFGESISLSGLSRIIANSLDALQNCSFFGMDKKDSSTSEALGASTHLDNKIGFEDKRSLI